jgi:hypothetical protein
MKNLTAAILSFVLASIILVSCDPCKDSQNRLARKESYDGVIQRKYHDSLNRDMMTLDLLNSYQKETIHLYKGAEHVFYIIEVGDTLIKPLNSLRYEIHTSCRVIYMYPLCCGEEFR